MKKHQSTTHHMKMTHHTASSRGAGDPSTKQGSLGEKTNGFLYTVQHNAENR